MTPARLAPAAAPTALPVGVPVSVHQFISSSVNLGVQGLKDRFKLGLFLT